MIQIDNVKMWESLLSLAALPPELHTLIEVALSDQNLKWNGKEIVNIESKQENFPVLEELERNGKDELTEFEKAVQNEFINSSSGISDEELKAMANRLLCIVRKQIASDINVEQMVKDYRSGIAPAVYESAKDLQAFCFQTGIEYTIKKIKGESV